MDDRRRTQLAAYYHWMSRGCPLNDDLADWFWAEAQPQIIRATFQLEFSGLEVFPSFDVPAEALQHPIWDGVIVGWSSQYTPHVKLVLAHHSNTLDFEGTLRIPFRGRVPHAGAFRLPLRLIGAAHGTHRVKGKGWAFSGIDAIAEVWATLCVVKNEDVVFTWVGQAGDETKSEDRTRPFALEFDEDRDVFFDAKEGDFVELRFDLKAHVWANSDGEAAVDVADFWVLRGGMHCFPVYD